MTKSVDGMVAEQLRRSELAREQRIGKGQGIANPVITISRTMGSGGRIVARKLADDMGFSLWDRELIDAIALEAEMPPSVVEAFDERAVSDLEMVIQGMLGRHEVASFMYPRHLARILAVITNVGNTVVLGRGANYLLPNALSVRMDASLQRRIENMLTYEDIDREAAEIQLRKSDRERERFIRQVFGKDKVRLCQFDLCLWMDNFTAADAAEIIETAFRARFKTG